jgi:hypothetical protein
MILKNIPSSLKITNGNNGYGFPLVADFIVSDSFASQACILLQDTADVRSIKTENDLDIVIACDPTNTNNVIVEY